MNAMGSSGYSLTRLSEPVVEPVSVGEVKAHTVIDHSADDVYLAALIKAVRTHGENITGRSFVETAFQASMLEFPASNSPICLPKRPFQSVTGNITYVSEQTGTALQLVNDVDFSVVELSGRGWVFPVAEWPRDVKPWSIWIQFKAGWPVEGVAPNQVAKTPDDIKAWINIRVAGLYAFREPLVNGRVSAVPRDFTDALLDHYTETVVV